MLPYATDQLEGYHSVCQSQARKPCSGREADHRFTNSMTSTRRFTWFDASVLVMAAMLATAEVRHRGPDMWLRLEHLTRVPMYAFQKWTWVVDYLGRAFVYQFLTAFTVATLLLRLINPHPPVRRLFRQPGTVALIGAVTGIIVTLLVRTGPTLHHLKYTS